MNINDLTIGDVKELVKMFGAVGGVESSPTHGAVGKKCIVRTYASGVHFGEVVSVFSNDGRSRCELKNARRIYYWKGAFTLSEVANNGIEISGSKVCSVVPQHFIEDAIELIPASEKAVEIIEGAKTYEP